MKRLIVKALERSCGLTHWFTHRRPWLWLPIHNGWCILARWSDELDQRWGTGVWQAPPQAIQRQPDNSNPVQVWSDLVLHVNPEAE